MTRNPISPFQRTFAVSPEFHSRADIVTYQFTGSFGIQPIAEFPKWADRGLLSYWCSLKLKMGKKVLPQLSPLLP
jgi:hypothetical protein